MNPTPPFSPAVSPSPRAVIVGAGFAGLWAARTLAPTGFSVMLVDRNNYHTFLPLLYQVAAAELEPEQIAFPVRAIFRKHRNVGFTLAEARSVDYAARHLLTSAGPIPYDYLLVAPGSVTQYFGIEGAAAHSFRLKTLEEGITLRNHILTCFERAQAESDSTARERLLTFVVVGGGATGVEFAGALAELIRGPLAQDYRFAGLIDPARLTVVLLEAMPGLLGPFPERLRTYAARRLASMGVAVRTGAAVERVEPQAVRLEDGEVIATETVVWTTGVKGEALEPSFSVQAGKDGRVAMLSTLQHPEHPEVFFAGDIVAAPDLHSGRPLPMLASVAMQQGQHVARAMLALSRGQMAPPFRYRDRGTMATIGRGAAISVIGRMQLTGFPAWVIWLVIHLMYLMGFRNRLMVLINWAVDYFFFEKAVRLILPKCLTRPRDTPQRPQAE